MPQHAPKDQKRINKTAEIDRWLDLDPQLSNAEIGRRVPCDAALVSRRRKHRRMLALTNGHHPTALPPVEVVGEASSAESVHSDASTHPDASARTDSTPATLPQRVEVVGEPVSTSPVHADASERISALERINSDHASRLATLEAFIATLQQQAHRSAPERINASAHADALQRTEPVEWVNRGTHLAADMIARIKAYASQHRLEMREVIDVALRRFFAEEDARHGD